MSDSFWVETFRTGNAVDETPPPCHAMPCTHLENDFIRWTWQPLLKRDDTPSPCSFLETWRQLKMLQTDSAEEDEEGEVEDEDEGKHNPMLNRKIADKTISKWYKITIPCRLVSMELQLLLEVRRTPTISLNISCRSPCWAGSHLGTSHHSATKSEQVVGFLLFLN